MLHSFRSLRALTCPRLALLASVLLGMAAVAPAQETPATGASDYLHQPDFFNQRLTADQRANPRPVHGGTLTIRTPSDEDDLNPLTSRSAGALEILDYAFSEGLISRDPITFEQVPWLAEWWQVQDVLVKGDGTRMVGLITTLEGTLLEPTRLEFSEGARRVTVGRHDFDTEQTNLSEGRVVLKDGTMLEGRIEEGGHTVTVETDGAEPLEIDVASLVVVEEPQPDGSTRTRPALNKQCLWGLKLRSGVTWQDGEPLKVADVVLGYRTMMNEFVKAAARRSYFIDVSDVRDAGNNLIEVELRRPYSLSYRVVGGLPILPSHLIDSTSYEGNPEAYGEYYNNHPMFKPGTSGIVGLGAYRLTRWADGRFELVRWPEWWVNRAGFPYWPEGAPYLDRIVFKVVASPAAAVNELRAGLIDADFSVDPAIWNQEDTRSAEFTSRIVRAKIVTPLFVYIGWNQRNPLFADPEVRRALAMMIPRERILRDLHFGMGSLVTGPYFVNGPVYDHTVEQVPYDPAAARRILRRLGWAARGGDNVLTKDGQRFEFSYLIHGAYPYHRLMAEILREEYASNGIVMNIDQVEWAIIGNRVRQQQFDAVRAAWQLSGFDDPDNYQIYHSSQSYQGGDNYVSYKNPELDRLLEAVRLEFDRSKRVELNREIHRTIAADQPYAFLFSLDQPYFYHNRFRNVVFYSSPPGYDLRLWYADPEVQP